MLSHCADWCYIDSGGRLRDKKAWYRGMVNGKFDPYVVFMRARKYYVHYENTGDKPLGQVVAGPFNTLEEADAALEMLI